MNRCTAMMMTVLGAAILSSCATATVATRGTGQRFQDGLYASSDDSQTKEDRQESERINDILIEKTKASEIYLFSETSKDTVVIPQNMAATIKFNGNDGTSVTVAQAPDWLQEDAWRYDWMYGPYFYRPYGYWYGSYYGGWRYDPWYGYYDPWYGGYYSHWYAFHSPWYGCYDPWYGCYDPWYGYYDPWFGHHHHHIFIEPMPDMGRKVVYASRNQTGTRGMSAGKLEGSVRTAVRSGANFTSSSTRTTPARERVVSKSRTDRTSTGDRLTPSSTSGYRRAGQTASSSSSSSASYRRPSASTDRSSSSTSGYSRSSSSSTSGYSRSSSSSNSGYSRSSSSSNSGYSRSSSSSNSGYSRSSSSSSSSYSRSSSSSNSGYSRSSSSSNSGYSRSSSSSSSSYSRGSSSSGYSGGGASRGGGYSGGSRR